MSEIGPWLVVGGAALVVVCAALTLFVVLRALRRGRRRGAAAASARSALAAAAGGGTVEDDRLMPLLLGAATAAAHADAAVVTFVPRGARRRSYSAGLSVREARGAIETLIGPPAPEPAFREREGPLPDCLVLPIRLPAVTGALAVYWRDEWPRAFETGELEQLVGTTFALLPVPADEAAPEPAREVEQERWSRLADLNATVEPALLLEKLAAAAVTGCGADAAAARMGSRPETEPVTDLTRFPEHERRWAESVLAAESSVPSITRYIAPRGDPAAGEAASIATAVVVPLRGAGGDAVGNLVAVWRHDLADAGDAKVAELERLVEDAGAALGNASRFQRLQSLAVRDPTTGLFDRRHFFGVLGEAVDTARRTSQPLALALFAASDIEPATDVPIASLEQALVGASERIAEAVGRRGVTCRVGLGDFAAVLPNAELPAAERLLDELRQELPDRAAGEARLTWSTSAVRLGEAEGADELWQRARRELRPGQHTPARPATSPVVSGPMRLSVGEGGDDWTLRKRPEPDGPGS